jgi:ABC-2 type transport system ATP-binding protein
MTAHAPPAAAFAARPPSQPAPIQCRRLTKHFGDFAALEDLTLEVPAGSVTGFLGPNGAGKTTVLRLLAGLTHPTSGEALLWGEPAAHAQARSQLGYMPADAAFAPRLSGQQNLDLLASLQRTAPIDQQWACELLGLSATELARPVAGYSSGMSQKLGIIQAVQHRPALVILDEPANRLDPLAHRRFEELIAAVKARGGTVFLSSHTLSEVQEVCDRVAMIRQGRLLDVRGVQELREASGRRVRITYDGDPPPRLPAGIRDPEVAGSVVTAIVRDDLLPTLRILLHDPAVVDLLVEELSLDESFVALYAEATG